MTTKPDYYRTPTECKASSRNRINTNPRYRSFTQTHFTAGDTQQFEDGRNYDNDFVNKTRPKGLLKLDIQLPKLYHQLNATTVKNTFNYIFHKMKKGIFVRILDNKLITFLPFSKNAFVNEWSKNLSKDGRVTKDMMNLLGDISGRSGYRFNPKSVNGNIDGWYANNCLVRFEYPLNEGDSGACQVHDMLVELCKNRQVPDIEFFVNRRDFPILTKNHTEAYTSIWGEDHPRVSYDFDKYSPILSNVTSGKFADVPAPTWDDWARVNPDKYFPKACKDYKLTNDVPWNKKSPVAVFRGGSTGCGVTKDDNSRIKLAWMNRNQKLSEVDGKELPYIDAGIVKWNLRSRVKNGKLVTISKKLTDEIGTVSFLTPNEQAKFKYVIHVDGHVAAFRLSMELMSGAVILKVAGNWDMWYTDKLEPFVHYVPVKGDLSDLYEKIDWCRSHDKECQTIVENAKTFSETYLSKDGILDYYQTVLYDLKVVVGDYYYNKDTVFDIQLQKELITPSEQVDALVYVIPHRYKTIAFSESLLSALTLGINMSNKFIRDVTRVFSNRSVTIEKATFAKYPMAIKTSKKIKESLHEVFIGTKEMNKLYKQIPNFAWIFGQLETADTSSVSIAMEYIQGETFEDYLKRPVNMKELKSILSQIALAVQYAQEQCCFVHYDLMPWNIMIRRFKNPVSIDYTVNGTVIRIVTKIIPVIIDYGKSRVVHDKLIYGEVNPFKFNRIFDMLSILFSSVYTILSNVKNTHMPPLFKLMNFITNSEYQTTPFTNYRELMEFLKKIRRYDTIIATDFKDLTTKTPMDFYEFLNGTGYKNTEIYTPRSLETGNIRQILDYIYSKTHKERLQTYREVFYRVKSCTIPQPIDTILADYTNQQLRKHMKLHMEETLYYLFNTTAPLDAYKEFYDLNTNVEVYLTKICENRCETYTLDTTIPEMSKIEYDKGIFSIPEDVLVLSKSVTLGEYNGALYRIIASINKEFNTSTLSEYINEYSMKYSLLTYGKDVATNNLSDIPTGEADDYRRVMDAILMV